MAAPVDTAIARRAGFCAAARVAAAARARRCGTPAERARAYAAASAVGFDARDAKKAEKESNSVAEGVEAGCVDAAAAAGGDARTSSAADSASTSVEETAAARTAVGLADSMLEATEANATDAAGVGAPRAGADADAAAATWDA
jgi:hypothetical protein